MAGTAVSEVSSPKESGENKALTAPHTHAFASELRGASPNLAYSQEITTRHADDVRYRASGVLPSDFQIAGRTGSKPLNSKYTAYEQPASQALAPPPPLSETLKTAPYDSPVKLNVQITNVPEVSQGLTSHELLNYFSTATQAGATVSRDSTLAITEHLAQPNALNNDALNFIKRYGQNEDQFDKDVQFWVGAASQQVEQIADTLDKPMTQEQRAEMAGIVLPLFLIDGKAMSPKATQQMGLEKMTTEELDRLGIKRVEVPLKLERDGYSIKASIPGDPKAFVEANVPSPGVVMSPTSTEVICPKEWAEIYLPKHCKVTGRCQLTGLFFPG
jgi:hypothetical protein